MIDRKQLDSLKLVQEDNFNPDEIVEADLEHAIGQGSQGWGVARLIGTILTLANYLRTALDDAEKASTDHNQLKGLQMENGRLKKAIEKKDAELLARDVLIDGLNDTIESLREDLAAAEGSDIPSSEGVDEPE